MACDAAGTADGAWRADDDGARLPGDRRGLALRLFLRWQNASYRGIHVLFVMPGLAALAQGTMRKLFRPVVALVLLALWGLSLQQLVAWLSGGSARPMGGSIAMYLYWIVHELAWWWIVAVFLAILAVFVLEAPMWKMLTSPFRRLRA
jgi:hypothetical protein